MVNFMVHIGDRYTEVSLYTKKVFYTIVVGMLCILIHFVFGCCAPVTNNSIFSLSAKKSLWEIRQLYYRLKDDVFASPRLGMAYNTSALEKLLVELFGTDMTMEHNSDIMPK